MPALNVQLRAAPGGVAVVRRVRARAAPAAAARAEWAASLRPYTIRRGDTLESIAAKRGLEVKELHRYNKNLSTKGAPLRARGCFSRVRVCAARAPC